MFRLLALFALFFATSAIAAEPPKLNILFLGGTAGHNPKDRFQQLEPVMAQRGIVLAYTDKLDDLNNANLNKYDGLMIYANQPKGTPEQVKAILDYVASGKGFIPLHCASFCFIDNDEYVKLVGAQFRSHTTGTFRTKAVKPEHPILKGYSSFESWDETYVHTKHNEKDRTVLEVRAEKDLEEPWTWVRTHGKGRVFYTAWGHDARTWGHEGFHNLVERGTRWACGQEPALAGDYADGPKMKPIAGPKSDFEYKDAKVPFYPPSKTWGVLADPKTKMQVPLSAEKSVKHYTMPEGFEMKAFATDSQFAGGKPLAMTWDEKGRLWVSVTMDYPNEMKKPGEGRDKILILEDTDGDGVADKVTTFADKLSIPTSLLRVHGGLIVHQAPDTLFLKDTDGDEKADLRIKLMSGWGTYDTHAGPSNLRYGFDNWIYGMVGYAGFSGTVAGEKFNFKQGLYRFKIEKDPRDPDANFKVTKLEFLRSVSNNAWGVGFDETGELFGSTANGCVLVHMPIANRYYEKVKGLNPGVLPPLASNEYHPVTDKVRQVDFHGGFTSAAGCAIYTARTYPKEYWNRTAFVSDPTGHLTATFVLNKTGTNYSARYGWNLVAADDEWAAPIDAQVGPDGNVWVLDWYNFIVQHNPVPQGFRNGAGNAYETELRDKTHGRIYRVVYTKAKPEKMPDLKGAKVETLVETLKNDNLFWRLQAQRLLVETRDQKLAAQLMEIIGDRKANEGAVIQALETLGGLELQFNPKNLTPREVLDQSKELKASAIKTRDVLVETAVVHESSKVRRVALQVLAKWPKPTEEIVKKIGKLATNDPDAGVQMTALLTLADFADSTEGFIFGQILAPLLEKLDTKTDSDVKTALTIASVRHAWSLFLAVSKSKLPQESLAILELAITNGTPLVADGEEFPSLFKELAESDPAVRNAVISGMTKGWPATKRPKLSDETAATLASLLQKTSVSSRGKLLKLASTWGVKGLDAQLGELAKAQLKIVADAKLADAVRLDAAKQILEFLPADEAAAKVLVESLVQPTTAAFAEGIVELLGQSKAKNFGRDLVERVGSLPTLAHKAALRLMLSRPEFAKEFLAAVERRELRFDELELDQRQALAAHPDAAVAKRAKELLAAGGGLPDPDRQKVIEALKPILAKTGDVGNGKKMFATHCAKCHKHTGEGAQIGPDLTGFAVHPKEEILIHVIDPSRSVEGNFKTYTASLLDGRVIQGLLASQSKTSVEILDAENKRHAIAVDDIDKLTESKKSLMPEGFEKTMKPEELTDLLEFLTQKGKYVPIPLDKYATTITTKGMFFEDAGLGERLEFRDWKPKEFEKVPFVLTDPQGDKIKNAILLYGPNGKKAPLMPKAVTLPCNTSAKAIHFLSGIGGWNAPYSTKKDVCLTVKLTYADGKTEEHEWKNGVHFADYIGRANVPESKYAFGMTGGQQVRYLSIQPKRTDAVIKTIELIKGPHESAPVVMAITIETP